MPERFVEEVRLDEAAARLVPFAPDRDVVFFAAVFEPLRLVERVVLLAERDAVAGLRDEEREADFAPVLRAAVFLAPVLAAAGFLAAVFLAPVFLAVVLLAADFVPRFAAAFVPAFLAPERPDDVLAAALVPFFAELREEDFAADFVPRFAAAFVPAFLAPEALPPDLAAVVFAAVFLAPVLLAPAFVAPVLRAPDTAILRDVVLRLRGVLVAEVSGSEPDGMPVSLSFCMVFDFSSVAIDRLLHRAFACKPSRLSKATSV